MKEKDARVDCDKHQIMLYVEKEDGSYGAVQTGAYMVKNHIDDFNMKRRNLEQSLWDSVAGGRISMVEYYRVLREMSPADLAARVGIRTSQVRKHMTVQGFEKLRLGVARRYAEVFGIEIADLFQKIVQPQPHMMRRVRHQSTQNPFVTITEYTEEQK